MRRFNNGDPLGGLDPVQGIRSALRLFPGLDSVTEILLEGLTPSRASGVLSSFLAFRRFRDDDDSVGDIGESRRRYQALEHRRII